MIQKKSQIIAQNSLILNTKKLKILSNGQFRQFSGIRKVVKNQYLIIYTNNNIIKCSLQHKFLKDKILVQAKQLKIHDKLSDNNIIINIQYKKEKIQLYDIVQVQDNNLFNIYNDIIVHNCNFTTSGNTVIDTQTLN